MKVGFVGVVEREETAPVVDELNDWNIFLNGAVGSRGVVNHRRFYIVVLQSLSTPIF